MSKKLWIQFFVLPTLRGVETFLRLKDADSTGADDEAADAVAYTIAKLEKWVNTPDTK